MISSLIKSFFQAKGIRFCQNHSQTDCDYIFLPPSASHCDVLLINNPNKTQKCRGDYITLLNTDETITEEINNKSLLISYGLNPLATITASSIRQKDEKTVFSCCLQRSIVTLKGKFIEPQEFPVAINAPVSNLHSIIAFVSLGLVLSFIPADFYMQ